ncbi:MAG: M28 family metallopeptidase [Promethearchaeota archaeon]
MSDIDTFANYAYDIVKKICTEIGPGCPCSPQEHKRAMIFKDEMEKFADSVTSEEFICAPKAFLGWFKLGYVLGTICVIFFWISFNLKNNMILLILQFISLAIGTSILLMLIFEFILSKKFIDFLYKKKKSVNIIGRILPKEEETKRIIIFSGHHDSALQFTWLRYLKYGYYFVVFLLIYSVFTLFFGSLFYIIYTLSGNVPQSFINYIKNFTFIGFPIGFIFGFFFTESGKNGGKVPGAVDNLSGSALAVAIGKFLKDNPDYIPENTEIRMISFGSEEAAVRGSRAYVKKHLNELKSKDTWCFNFDSICSAELVIFKSDRNNTLKNSREMINIVKEVAEKEGIPHKVKPFPFGGGGSDAIPFSEEKIKALTIFSMKVPSQMIQFYHQEFDNYDKIDIKAFVNSIKLGIEFVKFLKSYEKDGN